MAKNKNTFEKRQRELAKKEKKTRKLAERAQREKSEDTVDIESMTPQEFIAHYEKEQEG